MILAKYFHSIIIISHILIAAFTYYLAEATQGFFSSKSKLLETLLIILILDLAILIYLSIKHEWSKIAVLLLCFILPLSCARLAIIVTRLAIDDCHKNAEGFRLKILEYYQLEKHYPNSLKDIQLPICGRLFMNEPILKYKNLNNDFQIFYSDGFNLYIGSSLDSIEAKK